MIKKHKKMKYKIAISGAAETGHCSIDALEKAEELGKEIAKAGIILMTGATTGVPYWAAKGAKVEGGIVFGLSPAVSEASHIKTYHLPVDYHDTIIFTGFDFSGRNLMLTRSADAVIIICGRIGTLNEFTVAFENNKPIGVLEGTGGMADEIKEIIQKSHRGPGKMAYSSDPKELLRLIISLIDEEKKNNHSK